MSVPHESKSLGILSPYEAADILGVSAPTIRKWVDSGKLPGAFILPGTKERRIPAPVLRRYLITQGVQVIPTKLIELCREYEKHHGFIQPNFPNPTDRVFPIAETKPTDY